MQDADYNIVARILGDLGPLECSAAELAAIFAVLVEDTPVPVWIYDLNHRIVYNNRASCEFGTGGNIVGESVQSISSQIRELMQQGLAACRATGAVCTRAGWIDSPIIGERYLRFDFLPLPNGLMACLFNDTTDTKRVEQALRASEGREAFFAEMLECALVPFAAAYPDGRLLLANLAFCELTGYSEAELRSISLFRELTAAEHQAQESWALELLRSTGRPQRYEKLLVRHDGTTLPVEMFVQQINDAEGACSRLAVFATDISERRRSSEALHESEERFRLVAELATDGIWDWHIGAEEEYLSPRFKQMLGYEDYELDNHADTWERLIHPDDFQLARQAYFDHIERAKPFVFTARYYHKNGALVWVTCRGKAIKDAKGRYYRVVGTHTDVTESILAQARLAEAHEFSNKIIAASTVGIAANTAAGQCVLVNEAAAQIIGASREAILAQNFRQLESWRQSGLLAAADKALDTGCTQSGEYYLVTSFGKEVWWDCSLTPFVSNGELHLLTVITDISERRRAQQALRESEERLALALEGAADGIWDYNAVTGFIYRSPHMAQLLGYGAEGLEPTLDAWQAIVHPDDLQNVIEAWQAHIDGRTAQYLVEHRVRCANGEYLWISDSGNVVQSCADGRPLRIVGVHKNVTERKRAEEDRAVLEAQLQQAQKIESVGRLAGGVAHDFNNMLSVIIGHTELALGEVDPTHSLHASLEEIRNAAIRSSGLTRQLLAFARKQTIEPQVLNLNETLSGMLKMLGRVIGEHIELVWQPADELWNVYIDPTQIDQILANLCVNSRDAIHGSGRIVIETSNAIFEDNYSSAQARIVPGMYVKLTVSDDGCGIDSIAIEKLFEPFFTTKEIGHGTGLGLAAVYGAVKQNGGFINVYSEPGVGTTFKIYLPRYQQSGDRSTSVKPRSSSVRGNETILLVEDELAILLIVRQMLENQGYTVLAANSPNAAITLAQEHTTEIHMLLTDVVMPEMSGRELADYMLALYPQLRCIYMSGYTSDIIAHRGVLDEGIQFIEKPFSLNELSSRIRKVLDD